MSADPSQRQLRQDLIAIESAELARLYDSGTVAATRRELQRRLDLEHASLSVDGGR